MSTFSRKKNGEPAYARLGRRQSSTPDIPRAAWHMPEELAVQQTYAVVLDTSGSMDRHMLAAALGSIASCSVSGDVHAVRVIFCDAAVYDQGMMRPEEIAGQVKIRSRGGTVLQPAVDLLNRDESSPRNAPLLIITDGWCDRLNVPGRRSRVPHSTRRKTAVCAQGPCVQNGPVNDTLDRTYIHALPRRMPAPEPGRRNGGG